MTAFGRSGAAVPQGTLAWEIRSVNAKGLDLRLRLPPGLDALEPACRAMLGAAASRGTVHATLTLQRAPSAPEVRVDTALLRALLAAVESAVPAGSTVAPATMDGLLAVRGVVEVGDRIFSPADEAALASAVTASLEEALRAFAAAREAEGLVLGRLLLGHLDAIAAATAAAEAAPGRTPAAVLARLTRAVEALGHTGVALDPERLHQEAIILATRADVREELDRLAIHRASAAALLASGGAVGRRLDFLAQELGREANTLCAKSGDPDLTTIGLDLRNRIEQFREQVQNLE